MLRAHLEAEPGGSSEFLPALPATQGLCLFQSSSFSSITDSTMSLNIITVTLNMGESGETTLVSTCYMPDAGQTRGVQRGTGYVPCPQEVLFHKHKLVHTLITSVAHDQGYDRDKHRELWTQRMTSGKTS